jgi:hypothetical protein
MSNARRRSGNPAKAAAVAGTSTRTGSPSPAGRPILWASNTVGTTGYGTQTAQVIKRLTNAGNNVALASNYGTEGALGTWEGHKVFPRGFDVHSNDIIPAHFHAWNGEHGNRDDALLVTLYDVWVFGGPQWDQVPRILSWVPIDHMPAPPKVLEWLARPNVTPVAMSRFGSQMLTRAGLEHDYVPHAIEKVFKPTKRFATGTGQITGRTFMDVPDDAWLIGIVSANKGQLPNRKAFPEMFMAAGQVMRERDDVWLYVHTEDRGVMGGIQLHDLAAACGVPADRLRFADQYSLRIGIPQELMAACYTGMDVLLQTSMSEGFGIPAIEAQACGTPVIATNFSAQPELIGDGWLVDGQPFWDPMQRGWMVTPNVDQIVNALQDAYERPQERSTKAIEFASQYDADYVFDTYWRPLLDQV